MNISRRLFVRKSGAAAAVLTIIPGVVIGGMKTQKLSDPVNMPAAGAGKYPEGEGSVTIAQGKVELRTPCFILKLDTGDGLRAGSLENRLTGKVLSLGNGAEVELDTGESEQAASTVKLRVTHLPEQIRRLSGRSVFGLEGEDAKISVRVTYQWDATQPVLSKFVEIVNDGDQPLNRLLNVRLGTYPTDAGQVSVRLNPDRTQVHAYDYGLPVFLDEEFFFGIAHPSGWVTNQGKEVSMRQYPGINLAAGEAFNCMEAVYGVAGSGDARPAFLAYLTSRMRRVVRGHDMPYAIFEAFGGNGEDADFWSGKGEQWETEEYLLDNIMKVAQGKQESGCQFDYYSIDFWHDSAGDLIRFDPQLFPNGFGPIKEELAKIGTLPGLWISSGGYPGWSIGDNPAIKPAMAHNNQICFATEPAKSLYTNAFLHHIKKNGVRLLKLDSACLECNNTHHEHLPGIYSTEAIHNATIEFLRRLDRECPDVFLMLYWGYQSPWWLLHGDTIFEYGLPGMEAKQPASQPTPYARDSVIQRMDQGTRNSNTELSIPALGKDSLGVWLSLWEEWNGKIGKERWQESLVMDICRGSMLLQIWTDTDWLTPPERLQMADFIALMKARPECFRNSRWIAGDPWKNEPYGYCCTDGKRAFLAINNSCWRDSSVALSLNPEWGLPSNLSWDIYRWYPDPARLVGRKSGFGESASITLRPFEVVLLEVVPAGELPALDRRLKSVPIPAGFTEPAISIKFNRIAEGDMITGRIRIPPASQGGTIVMIPYQVAHPGVKVNFDSNIPGPEVLRNIDEVMVGTLGARLAGLPLVCTQVWSDKVLIDTQRIKHGNAAWAAWRIPVGPSSGARDIDIAFRSGRVQPAGELALEGFFIPNEK